MCCNTNDYDSILQTQQTYRYISYYGIYYRAEIVPRPMKQFRDYSNPQITIVFSQIKHPIKIVYKITSSINHFHRKKV